VQGNHNAILNNKNYEDGTLAVDGWAVTARYSTATAQAQAQAH